MEGNQTSRDESKKRINGSFIVALALFAGITIISIGINMLIREIPVSPLGIGLVFGSLIVLIYTKPTIMEYISLEESN